MWSLRALCVCVLAALLALASGGVLLPRPSGPSGRLFIGRIVGGVDADIRDFPYQVSFRQYGSHFCGASIISKSFALTAGHCTSGITPQSTDLSAGSSLLTDGQGYKIARITGHPLYDAMTIDFDAGVIQILGEFLFGDTQRPVKLPPVGIERVDPDGDIVTASGWGVAKENSYNLESQLQSVRLHLVNQSTCSLAYDDFGGVTARMLCASDAGKDACQGDSGGPLVNEAGTQVGIVSWGLGCARKGYPGVYTRIANEDVRKFIATEAGV